MRFALLLDHSAEMPGESRRPLHDFFVPNDTTSGFGDDDGAGNV